MNNAYRIIDATLIGILTLKSYQPSESVND